MNRKLRGLYMWAWYFVEDKYFDVIANRTSNFRSSKPYPNPYTDWVIQACWNWGKLQNFSAGRVRKPTRRYGACSFEISRDNSRYTNLNETVFFNPRVYNKNGGARVYVTVRVGVFTSGCGRHNSKYREKLNFRTIMACFVPITFLIKTGSNLIWPKLQGSSLPKIFMANF
jgi:hypothetical protein